MSYTSPLENINYSPYAGTGDFYEYQENDDIDVDLIEVEESSTSNSNDKARSEISLLAGMTPRERQKFEEQQRMILKQLQQKSPKIQFEFDESDSSDSSILSHSSIFSLISQYASMNDQKTTIPPKSAPSLSKLMSFNFKGKLSRNRNSRHVRMLSELKIPIPEANEPIVFESKAAKLFDGLPICTLPPHYDPSGPPASMVVTKVLPSENVILSLAMVYAISEHSTPEPHIRIDYISGPKKHEYVSIISQNLQDHRQWLTTIRLVVRAANAVGPYLTLVQREWLMEKLKNLDDLEDENEDNLVGFRVLLKSLTDEDFRKENDKEPKVPVIFVLGRNNVYLIPFNLIGNDLSSSGDGKKDFKIRKQPVNHPLLIESVKSKEIEFHKFQYPLLCLTSIDSEGKDDTFQLTFKNTSGTMKRTLTLSSLVAESIITEIRTAIDSITFWWPSPGYQLRAPSNMQATIIPPEREGDKTSQAIGFDRMIEAQCHANRVNRSRIVFNIEYVLGAESISLGLGVDHLPFRFILLPPASKSSQLEDRQEDSYSNQELMAIFNSLKYHPLLHEIILRNTNLFELQIQPGHKGTNMLAAVLNDLLLSNPRLGKLDLTSCGITNETVSAIGEAFMTGQSCLERLLLGNNSITREGAQALASGMTGHKSAIKELDISNCKLTHDSIESILHALDTNDPGKLEVLNISNNTCDLESDILTELLSKTVSLRTLNLHDSPKFFSRATPVISIETLGNTQLTTLNLGGVSLNNGRHLEALYTYIQSPAFAKIRFLKVDHCDLDGEAVTIILSYVTTSPNYKKIRVWAGGNHIMRTPQGHKDLCNAIRNDWTPIWLSLKDTIFGSDPETVAEVLQSFCENTVIKYLDLSYPKFKSPNHVKIARVACEIIGKIFRENKSIRELDLYGNPECRFGPSLGGNLFGLEENDTLEKLNIKGNAVSDQGAKALSEALKYNTKLRVINCDENEIGIEGYNAIHRVLTTDLNTTIQQFAYPTQDLETHNESLDAKLTIHSRDSILFSSPTIKMSQRTASEKKKVNFRRVIDEIMRAIDENIENAEDNSPSYDTFKSTSTSDSPNYDTFKSTSTSS